MNWISVRKSIPTYDNGNVLISTSEGEVTVGRYIEGKGWWSEEWGWIFDIVTHWAPKPKGPTKKAVEALE